MAITEVEPRPVGRPPAAKGTVRILPSGVIRLSPDLCTAKTYSILFVTGRVQQLLFKPGGPFKLRYSGPNAQSGRLMASSVFAFLGASAKVFAGEYEVQKVKDGFVVSLDEQ